MKNEPNIKRNALLDRIYEQSVKMSGVKIPGKADSKETKNTW